MRTLDIGGGCRILFCRGGERSIILPQETAHEAEEGAEHAVNIVRLAIAGFITLLFIYRLGRYRLRRYNMEHFGLSVMALLMVWGTTLQAWLRVALMGFFGMLAVLFLMLWITGRRGDAAEPPG